MEATALHHQGHHEDDVLIREHSKALLWSWVITIDRDTRSGDIRSTGLQSLNWRMAQIDLTSVLQSEKYYWVHAHCNL
jgi:hypothetical protein